LDGALAGLGLEAVRLDDPPVEARGGQRHLGASEVDPEHEVVVRGDIDPIRHVK
jgi:hypothetical protein